MSWEPQVVRTVDLGYEQLLVIEDQRGALIRVLHGGVWLTEEGLGRDIFAESGDEVRIEGEGRAVVEGLGSTQVELVRPAGSMAATSQLVKGLVHRATRALSSLRTRDQLGRTCTGSVA
jgi:hypothetical protein